MKKGIKCQEKRSSPNPDLEEQNLCPTCHCEHPKGARQSHGTGRDCFVSLAMTIPKSGFGSSNMDESSIGIRSKKCHRVNKKRKGFGSVCCRLLIWRSLALAFIRS